MFDKMEKGIELAVGFVERIIGLILKVIFELAPVLLVGFIIIAVIVKAFQVIVLGQTP